MRVPNRSVMQDWTCRLPMMLTAVRGPDGVEKYGEVKYLLRWYRRCMLLSAMDGRVLDDPGTEGGGSFTGPSIAVNAVLPEPWERCMDRLVNDYLRQVDGLPHHFHMHLVHAAEILGNKHPVIRIRSWWRQVYLRLVRDMHMHAETEEEMNERLGDSREGWLRHADTATIS